VDDHRGGDVPGSLKWYQALFGQPATLPAHDYFGQILDSDGPVLLCLRALRDKEKQQLLRWLEEDGGSEPGRVFELLKRSGVPETELVTLDLNSNGIDALFQLPEDRGNHQRARELIALLVLAAAAGRPDRLKHATRWLSARQLVGWPDPLEISAEEVIEMDEESVVPIGSIEVDHAVVIDQQLAMSSLGSPHVADLYV
jgi:hypothetical protein